MTALRVPALYKKNNLQSHREHYFRALSQLLVTLTRYTSPTSYSDDAEDFEDDEIPDDGDEDVMEDDDGTA